MKKLLLLILALHQAPLLASTADYHPKSLTGDLTRATQKPVPTSAKGRAGPIELKLTIQKPYVRAREKVFFRTTLTNFDKNPMVVADWVFRGSESIGAEWSTNSQLGIGVYIEVKDAAGRKMKVEPYHQEFRDATPFEIAYTTVSAEDRSLIQKLKSEGVGVDEINRRLLAVEDERTRLRRDKQYPVRILKQGESTSSIGWCSEDSKKIAPCPVDGFVELAFFKLERSGRYWIRAVRNRRVTAVKYKQLSDQWSVLVSTPWIEVEVIE